MSFHGSQQLLSGCSVDSNTDDTLNSSRWNVPGQSLFSIESTSSFDSDESLTVDERLLEVILKYEIRPSLSQRLYSLQNYEIIVVCDDSTSMRKRIRNTNRTRWDQLRDFVKIVLEIGTIFDSSGVDIYFLNRKPVLNVTDPRTVDKSFSIPPAGFTPLTSTLRKIFQLPITYPNNEKKVVVFIATDGVPTDKEGNSNIFELHHLLTKERCAETTHIMFLICTDDETCVNYLSEWDRTMTNVDVTDNFMREREKIRLHQGKDYPFSYGDYVAKALLGAIDHELDDLNEPNTEIV